MDTCPVGFLQSNMILDKFLSVTELRGQNGRIGDGLEVTPGTILVVLLYTCGCTRPCWLLLSVQVTGLQVQVAYFLLLENSESQALGESL